ncbi:hypothetical protein [Streptomyces sp. NPDC058385]
MVHVQEMDEADIGADYQADGAAQDDVYDGITLTELRYQRVL